MDNKEFSKDLEKALTLAKRTRELRPGEPAVLDTLGWIYYQMEDLNQAIEFVEKALAGQPESPIFNYHMGMALYKSGRR
jgi:tetratricopeptide (TPR) repeat protein